MVRMIGRGSATTLRLFAFRRLLPMRWPNRSLHNARTCHLVRFQSTEFIVVDGSKGEGGGQILRNSISYAAILRQRLRIHNVRAGRSNPGLRAQHLTGLQLVASIYGGTLKGDSIGSTEIEYEPASNSTEPAGRTLTADIGTAGSICLLLQAALPCLLLDGATEPCRLVLKGGTNATLAPQYDYWEQVFLPTICRHCGIDGVQIQAAVIRRGYFPKGGGEVHVRVHPCQRPLAPINLIERGDVCNISIRSFHAGRLPRRLAQEMADSAQSYLNSRLKQNVSWSVDVVTENVAVGTGLGVLVVANTTSGCLLAGSALCSPKQQPTEAGVNAASELWSTLQDGGCVDEWLQDQLILYAALAEGRSEILTGSLTLHTQTAIAVAKQLAGARFEVVPLSDGAGEPAEADAVYGSNGRIPGKHVIRCEGIGYRSRMSIA